AALHSRCFLAVEADSSFQGGQGLLVEEVGFTEATLQFVDLGQETEVHSGDGMIFAVFAEAAVDLPLDVGQGGDLIAL
ncbi:MAG: hypothetical protein QGH40_04000, partial [bacterium]|nr:hypothetical protein [bacterium]